jgi:probable addiction module antidote protein
MTKAKAPPKLVAFDAAKYFDDDVAIAEYMTAVLETEDPDLLLLALGDVARPKDMAQVARDARLGRESLYAAARPIRRKRRSRRPSRRIDGATICSTPVGLRPPGQPASTYYCALMVNDMEQLLLLQCEQLAHGRVAEARTNTERESFSMIESACRGLRVKRGALSPRNRAALERLVLDLAARCQE